MAASSCWSRRLLGEPVIGVVEHREHVALAHRLAHLDLALHDLAADAERLVHLVPRLHGADVAVGLRGFVVAQLDGAHGAQRLGWRFVPAARRKQGGDRYGKKSCGAGGVHDGSPVR